MANGIKDTEWVTPVLYRMEQINGDNHRPGMPAEGYLVRYNLSDYGWLNMRTFPSKLDALEFCDKLNEHWDNLHI